MPGNVEWIELGLAKIMANVARLDDTRVRVGVVGEGAHRPSTDGRLKMAEVAIINELGAPRANIPPRHFVRDALHTPTARALAMDIAAAAVTLGNVDGALHRAGEKLAEEMRDRIYRGDFEGNAASTIKKKGFDHPLIDSSGLADAITYQLVRGDHSIVDAGAGDYHGFQIETGGTDSTGGGVAG